MDSVASDSRLQFISSPDIESNARSSRAFSAIEAGNNRDSIVSRSRLLSRASYHHYTQSIYSELNRARGMTHINEENKAEHTIPVLDQAESIKMIRHLKKGANNDWEVQIYLEDASTSSREPFKVFSWKLASNNALFFSYEPNEEKVVHHKPVITDTNFIYLVKEDTPDINSTDVFFETKDDEEKLGRVSKYGGQDAEDVIVTDPNGALLYKIVEDLKPASEDFACIVLDLLGNKVGNGNISLLETDALSCQISFPQETTSKEKVLILTAFLFKLIQLGAGIQWNAINKTLASSIISSESCLLCFLKGK